MKLNSQKIFLLSLIVLALLIGFSKQTFGNGAPLIGCGDVGGICKTACDPEDTNLGQKDCQGQETCCVPPSKMQLRELCWGISDDARRNQCLLCVTGQNSTGTKGMYTALGCIPVENANGFIKWFLGRAILLAGGVAFLLMLSGGLMVIVSSGDPNRVKAGSELITSALAGLLFIIFSLFLLRLVGVEILQIPGL